MMVQPCLSGHIKVKRKYSETFCINIICFVKLLHAQTLPLNNLAMLQSYLKLCF